MGAWRGVAWRAELMLLGFISLLLTVFQDRINKICMAKHLADEWLPCKKKEDTGPSSESSSTAAHFQITAARHLLAEASDAADFCTQKVRNFLRLFFGLRFINLLIDGDVNST